MIAVLLINTSCTLSEDEFSSRFIPLSKGNSWTLKSQNDRTPGTILLTVTGDTVLQGEKYSIIEKLYDNTPNPVLLFVRVDSRDRLNILEDVTREYFFDFKKADDKEYNIGQYTVTVTQPDTISTPMGAVSGCIDFYMDNPAMADEEFGYAFAEDIGFVRIYGSWGADYRLVSYTHSSEIAP